jgi:cold shock CspA family protein/GTPase SAR1 family protein
MLDQDSAFAKLKEIVDSAKGNISNIQSEEDAKIQIINRILTDALGWLHTDIRAESKHDNGFSDYILADNETPSLLIEAKRLGIIVIESAEKAKVRHFKISGTSLKKAIDGIDQAYSYAAPNGLPVAVLTDGVIWVFFKTFTPGSNFKDKEAIVFPSFNAIINDFATFFELLSKHKVRGKIYNSIFDEIHQNRTMLTEQLYYPVNDGEIYLSRKSELAFDLERVFTNFFAKLSGENDEDLLFECFVESKESRIADFSLEKMTTSVLGNINLNEKAVDKELIGVIEQNVESGEAQTDSGETVFIVGPTGSGKTTFIDRFFKKTLPKEIREKCILLNVNFLDASGSEESAIQWLIDHLIYTLEGHLYQDSTPNWNDLLGLYFAEYKKRIKGVDSQLYKRDKEAFREKFAEYLDKKVEEDREGYLKRMLEDVVHNRKMLPIILIDNTDEFPNSYKERVFQFTQSLRRLTNHSMVIFPVTDKTAWSFSKTDIYGIYSSKSFFLPTPSPREVFRKRINFLKDKLHVSNDGKNKSYFSNRGIKISIEDLGGFAEVLENVFVNHDYTSKTIGQLTNFNIRRTLLLSQRVITSSEIQVEDLIKSFLVGKIVTTSYNKFVNALLKGDYNLYKKGDRHEVIPIFQSDNKVRQSPLLKLRILSLLGSLGKSSTSIEDRHISIDSILHYFDALGCSETAVYKAIESLFESGLVEPYDASSKNLASNQMIAISYRGKAHLRLASHNSPYLYQMALTTGITDEEKALQIRSIYNSDKPFIDKVIEIRRIFFNYLLNEDSKYVSIEVNLDQYACQEVLIENLRKFDSAQTDSESELVAAHGPQYKPGLVKSEIIVTVEWFDSEKGFGFADSEELDARIFFHSEKLLENGIKTVSDGDEILCDIFRSEKGFNIEKIHDVETHETKHEEVDCTIIRVFQERNYGFVKINGTDREAFFHKSIFPEAARSGLSEGYVFRAEIMPDKKGRLYQVRRALS